MALHVSCSSLAWAIGTWWGMLGFWKVLPCLQCAWWSIVQFSRFKLIIWPAESNSKQCGWESGWNWWNYHIWYAKCRRTCMKTRQRVCLQVRWHLFATLNAIRSKQSQNYHGLLTWATKVISNCRKITDSADRQCAVWYITFLNGLSLSMWPETGKEQKSAIYMQKTPVWKNWWPFCEVSLCIEKHPPVKFTLVRNHVLFLANTLEQLFV